MSVAVTPCSLRFSRSGLEHRRIEAMLAEWERGWRVRPAR